MIPNFLPQEVESNYSSQEVLSQLNLILAHELFNNSAVLSNFLKYIVEETLVGNFKSLKEYTIGVDGLGKKADFNPQIDAIVRIHAGRLRRLLTKYYNGPGLQDRIVIEVVKGSYVPLFSQRNIEEEAPMVLSPFLHEIRHVFISKVTIAILPFRNLCPNSNYQFFVDGLGEEFTRTFSHSKEFAVIGHHSTLKYSLQHTSLHTIGLKLNAQYILTGTVIKSENHFRISVGLVETELSIQLWSKVFDYDEGVGFLQAMDQTSQEVYSLLGGQFGFIIQHKALTQKTPSEGSIAFDPVLYNYQFHTSFSFFNYVKMRKVLERIEQIDPHSSIALAMLSELYLWGHILGYPTVDAPVATSFQLAQKAKNIDPLSRPAGFSYLWASLYSTGTSNLPSEVEYLRDQNPLSALEAAKLGTVLVWQGHYESGRVLLEQWTQHNPHYPWSFNLALALVYFQGDRYAESLEVLNRISATDIYLVDLLKFVLLTELELSKEAQGYLDSLVENYAFIASNLKNQLSRLLLDNLLIDKILKVVSEAQSMGNISSQASLGLCRGLSR